MKVVKSKEEPVTFGELGGGDAFTYEDGGSFVYIKLYVSLSTFGSREVRNAVCVNDGTSATVQADTPVMLLPNAVLYCNGGGRES